MNISNAALALLPSVRERLEEQADPKWAGLLEVVNWQAPLPVGASWYGTPQGALAGAIDEVLRSHPGLEDAVADATPGGISDPDEAKLLAIKIVLGAI